MRILHAHKYFHARDGASRYERGLMRLQEEAGHTVAPFAMKDDRNDPTPWSEYFVSNIDTRRAVFGLHAVKQALRALWCLEAAKKFDAMLETFQPDIIHVHNIYTQISPSILAVAKRRGIPVVMTLHDYALVSANYSLWDGDKSMDMRRLGIFATAKTKYIKGSFLGTLVLELILKFHRLFSMYDGAICHYLSYSDFVKDVFVQSGFSPENISVVGAFAEPFMQNAAPRKRVLSREPFVLFAGRLETYKGVYVLLDALKYLPRDTRLVFAGTGPEESRMKMIVGKDPRVTFLGFVPGKDLWKLMSQATAVVVPSVWSEPFGLVALEAMCQGTPIITAKSGGLQEILGESDAGILVPPGDARALSRAIERLLDDPALAAAMGDSAEKRARELGNPQTHLAKVMQIYSQCL